MKLKKWETITEKLELGNVVDIIKLDNNRPQIIKYKIETTKGIYLQKIYVDERLVPVHIDYLTSLSKTNLPVQKIITTKSFRFENRQSLLFEYVQGETFEEFTDDQFAEAAKVVARMHLFSEEYWSKLHGKNDSVSMGYIHNDVHPGNFVQSETLNLIDFDNVKNYLLVKDIASIIFYGTINKLDHLNSAKNFSRRILESYESVKKLKTADKKFIKPALAQIVMEAFVETGKEVHRRNISYSRAKKRYTLFEKLPRVNIF